MVSSVDFRWQIVSLIHMYNLDVEFPSELFGLTPRNIWRWYNLFKIHGVVEVHHTSTKSARWPQDVLSAVSAYCRDHPTFYLEELQMCNVPVSYKHIIANNLPCS